jgi:hypothetical protein
MTRFKYSEENFWPLLVNKNAHKRVENPNYAILNKAEVKNAYKSSLVIPFTKHTKAQAQAQAQFQNKCIKVN